MAPQIWVTVAIFLIGQSALIIAALFKFQANTLNKYKELEIKITELQVRINASEKRLRVVESDDKTIIHKLDSIIETIHQIDMRVANKKDRDN